MKSGGKRRSILLQSSQPFPGLWLWSILVTVPSFIMFICVWGPKAFILAHCGPWVVLAAEFEVFTLVIGQGDMRLLSL